MWVSLGRDAARPDGVLALEACRAADRLDELDRVIQGKGVLNLMQFRIPHAFESGDESVTVEVKFDNVLSEARQQQNVLRQLVVTLDSMGEARSESVPAPTAPEVSTPLDELNRRRTARGSGASRAGGAKVASKRG